MSEAQLNQNLITTITENSIEAPVRVYVGLNNSSAALIRVAISQWKKDKWSSKKNSKARVKVAEDLIERMDEILDVKEASLTNG
jgi:hypothetical protein